MSTKATAARATGKEDGSERATQLGSDASEHLGTLPVRLHGTKLEIVGGEQGKRKLMRTLGIRSPEVLEGLLIQLAGATLKDGQADQSSLKLMLHFIADGRPRDLIETLLFAQMAIAHAMAARYASYTVGSENILQQDSGERIFSKAVRTFAMQMEALQRHRTLEMQALGVAREKPPDKLEAPLAITDARAVPMEILQKPDAAVVSMPSERDVGQ
jgi:hypothetical protein